MPILPACGFGLFEGVVGGTDKRASFDVLEAHGFAEHFEFGEFVGMDVPRYGEMIACRLEVLAEGKKVGALSRKILQRG